MKEFLKTIDKIVDLVGDAANIVATDDNVEDYLREAMAATGYDIDYPDIMVIDYIKELFKNN